MASAADVASVTMGWIPYVLVGAATVNETLLKATAGRIGYIVLSNEGAADAYLKLFNKATAPAAGTDTPVFSMRVGPGATETVDLTFNGVVFNLGIGFAITASVALLDNTAIPAGEVTLSLGYR